MGPGQNGRPGLDVLSAAGEADVSQRGSVTALRRGKEGLALAKRAERTSVICTIVQVSPFCFLQLQFLLDSAKDKLHKIKNGSFYYFFNIAYLFEH